METSTGYIKLHKQILGSRLFKYHGDLIVFLSLLLQATFKRSREKFKGQMITLEPGQLIISIRDLAKVVHLQPTVISRSLEQLVLDSRISKESSSEGTLITVLNWEEYQTGRVSKADIPVENETPETTEHVPGLAPVVDLPQLPEKFTQPPIASCGTPALRDHITPPVVNTITCGRDYSPAFLAIYKVYPKCGDKFEAWQQWKTLEVEGDLPETQNVLDAIDVLRESEQWTKEGGQYIPKLNNFLREMQWKLVRPFPEPGSIYPDRPRTPEEWVKSQDWSLNPKVLDDPDLLKTLLRWGKDSLSLWMWRVPTLSEVQSWEPTKCRIFTDAHMRSRPDKFWKALPRETREWADGRGSMG